MSAVVAGLALWLAQADKLAGGMVYAAGFVALVFVRPELALAAVFALAPFQWDVGGLPVKFSISELNLAFCFVAALLGCAARGLMPKLGVVVIPVGLYFFICLVSSLPNWRGTTTVSLAQQFVYMVAAVVAFTNLVRRPEALLPALYGLVLVCAVFSVVMMASGQAFGIHKNGIGASLSSATVVVTELWFAARSRRGRIVIGVLAAVLFAGLVISLSRGAWMAAIVGVATCIGLRGQWKLLLRMSVVAVPAVLLAWSTLPEQQQEYAFGFERDRVNIGARYANAEYALEQYRQNPLLGTGVGFRKEHDATNIVMTNLAEVGIAGLIAFGLIHVVFLRMVWKTQKHMRRDDPLFSPLVLGAALLLGRLAHGMVDHYWSRGAITPAWCAVGMATAVWFARRGVKTPGRAAPVRTAYA